MKYFYITFYCLITTSISAQFENDSIKWNLSSNDSVSYALRLRGLKQNLAINIPPSSYINGYQKITQPTTGWPSIPDINLNNSFIEFPFGTEPDICYDTTGGNRYCLGYASFYPTIIRLKGYVPQVADSVIMDVYFFDTSCFAALYGNNYKYLGNIIIKSDNNFQPTNINFRLVEENDNKPIEACGAGGKYSAIRLYPRTGGDLFIKDMIIAGFQVIALPIHFKYVRASVKDETIELSWAIENIQDLQKFIIEKSADGGSFIDAAIINEPGNINSIGAYNWIDKYPFEANNFYRVKALEKTGKVIFSQIVKVNNTIKAGRINIYPNPVANKSLNISMKNVSFGKYQLIITNETGQNVFSIQLYYAGENQKTITLPKEIVEGVYYIKMENADYRWNKKVIIL